MSDKKYSFKPSQLSTQRISLVWKVFWVLSFFFMSLQSFSLNFSKETPLFPRPLKAKLTEKGLLLTWEPHPKNQDIKSYLYYELHIKDELGQLETFLLPPQAYEKLIPSYQGNKAYWIELAAVYNYQKSIPLSYFLRRIHPQYHKVSYAQLLSEGLEISLPLTLLQRDILSRKIPDQAYQAQLYNEDSSKETAVATPLVATIGFNEFSNENLALVLLSSPQDSKNRLEPPLSPIFSLNSVMDFLQQNKGPKEFPFQILGGPQSADKPKSKDTQVPSYSDSVPYSLQAYQSTTSKPLKDQIPSPISSIFEQAACNTQASSENTCDSIGQELRSVETFSVLKEELSFEDPHLEQALKAVVSGIGGPLRRNSLQDVEKLDLSNKNIRSLKGLEKLYFPKLQVLDLSSNQIQAWPKELFSRFSSLKGLVLRDNPLNPQFLGGFIGLQQLEYLDLIRTRLKSIPRTLLEPLKELRRLYIPLAIVDSQAVLDLISRKEQENYQFIIRYA